MQIHLSKNRFIRRIQLGNDLERRSLYYLKNPLGYRGLSTSLLTKYANKDHLRFNIKENIGYSIIQNSNVGKLVAEESNKIISNKEINKKIIDYDKKPYLITGNTTLNDLIESSTILQFAINEDLIIAITNYLNEIPILRNIDILYSTYTPSKKYQGSQLFHCDWEDERQIKLFVFSNNIGINDGPINLINAKKSQEIKRKINYKYSNRVQDQLINKFSKPDDIHELSGPLGTILLCDTSRCFHFGSRLNNKHKPRIITQFQYLRPSAIGMNKKYNNNLPFKDFPIDNISPLQRFVLTGKAD